MVKLVRLLAALTILVAILSHVCLGDKDGKAEGGGKGEGRGEGGKEAEAGPNVLESVQALIRGGFYERAWTVLSAAEATETETQPDIFYYLGHMYENGLGRKANFSAAFHEYLKGANAGSARCQMQASVLLSNGHGVKVDEGAAVLLLIMASQNGLLEAKIALSNRYQHGVGVEKSCFEALRQCEPVAQHSFLEFQSAGTLRSYDMIRLGSEEQVDLVLERDNLLELYAEEAAEGNSAAQTLMGISHLTGANGVDRNVGMAREYLEQAAASGDVQAQTTLGQMYVGGIGVEKDNATALRYFMQAAKTGNVAALNGLGYMYLHGMGVEEDHKAAIHYFELASQAGSADANFNLGVIYYGGTSKITADKSRGLDYLMKAAQMQHIGGMYQIGRFFMMGKDVKISCETALSYLNSVVHQGPECGLVDDAFAHFRAHRDEQALMLYTKAAEMGLEVAQENVAYMYEHRLGVSILDFDGFGEEMDEASFEHECDVRALHWYGRAASQRSATALIKVGDYHYYGIGTARNASLAMRYYENAARRKNAQAHFNLGYMKQYGIGVPKDLIGARRSYILSLTEDPKGYLPVKLALIWLRLQEMWGHYVGVQWSLHGFKLFVLSIRSVDIFLMFSGLIIAILAYIRMYA